MGKLSIIKKKIMTLVFALGIISCAIAFSLLLGKYYLNNVVKSYPVTTPVYKTVYYPVKLKKVRLAPVSVYTLQAGVFTDKTGAEQFAATLTRQGLRPYVTPSAPHKVFLFAASSREKLMLFKDYTPLDSFIANDILNESEVEVSSDKKFWLEFLPVFSELYSQTINVVTENDSAEDKELSAAWQKLSTGLKKEKLKKEGSKEAIDILAEDFKKIAQILNSQRSNIQTKGLAAQILLKTKYDFDNLRQFLAEFD